MTILPRWARSTSANDENETPDSDFWKPAAWPGKPDELRTLKLPAEDPNLLSARPEPIGGREYAASVAAAEYEFAVLQNLDMLEAN